MMVVAFDALAYVRRLEQGGVPRETVVTQAEALAGAIEGTLVTKQDLKNTESTLKAEITAEIESVRTDLKIGLTELRGELRTELAKTRGDMMTEIAKSKVSTIVWLVSLSVIATAAQIAARVLLH
ncbi:hypothetical protein WKR88_19435 [Trinickia caryophylli]|uniref:DUF1640 domain-containing protein n=1 Tax=Trinickia caryophylli TaxID=28094 RepID=A0A1X7DE88_TRICW|nr:hypothetical protein [Trinickia caryophylli]PMS09798.1 hypothetical protein C0Z17_23290 [Trinickia caryophylli]TRX16863.1 hypothetical protein FNF07_00545 [Trinickia caryophylli]WQE12407.1 hypothetical protein U0034_02995 [Trinickia caryophylli]SMF13854.1 hypothetical protein SAMN06295900_10373 [Trinickia caryophylli]GLU31445.1 hypothetical protein Busp01_12870 [Trinickia caryophylli]